MSNKIIAVFSGILPTMLRQIGAHNEVTVLKRSVSTFSPIQSLELPATARVDRHPEAWQEKPNRQAGFAAARRKAKKNRRRNG